MLCAFACMIYAAAHVFHFSHNMASNGEQHNGELLLHQALGQVRFVINAFAGHGLRMASA